MLQHGRKRAMITFRIVDETGGARFFQFGSAEIRIGFRPGADIGLEPRKGEAGEIRVVKQPDGGYQAEPVGPAGAFFAKGAPVKSGLDLRAGDMLSAGTYRIFVEEVVAEHAAAEEAPETSASVPGADGPAPASSAVPGKPSGSKSSSAPAIQIKPGSEAAAYLVLFFEPVRKYIEDDDVSEIMINGPNEIYIERRGKVEATDARFINEQALEAAVKNVARSIGRFFNLENPRLDARFPDGSRVHAVMPPLARGGTVVAIRKFRKEKLTMAQLVSYGSVSEEGAMLIDAIVKLHKNVIVSGPTSSGKTSVLNVLSSSIDADERILVIEDASELQLQQKHTVYFETRKPDEHSKGEVTIRDLVASSLRLRPDRLIIGEIRGGESLDMLQAMNTGHAGSMSTIHANSPVDCLSRIETCALLSGIAMPLSAIRNQVAAAINMVVHTARLSDGSRKITNVSEVLPLRAGEYAVQDLIYFRPEGLDSRGKLKGRHVGAGVKPGFFKDALLHGIKMEEKWFKAVD